MNDYLAYLLRNIKKEIEYVNKDDQNKRVYKCIVDTCEIFSKGYIAKILQTHEISKNPMRFHEEEKAMINDKYYGTVLEAGVGYFTCKVGSYLKPGAEVDIKRKENNITKVLDTFEKFIELNKPIHECITNSFKNNGIDNNTDFETNQEKINFDFYESSKNICESIDEKNGKVFVKIAKPDDLKSAVENRLEIDLNANKIAFEFLGNNKEINYEFKNKNLNNSQKNAISEIFKNKPYKILGPPGTGKTTTIVEIIYQLLQNNKKVLVCGPSNTSVDNILLGFLKLRYKCDFFRLGSSYKCFDGFECFNLNEMAENSVDYLCEELDSLKIKKATHTNKKSSKNSNSKKDNYRRTEKYSKGKEIRKISIECSEVVKEKKKKIEKFCFEKTKNANIIFSTLFSSMRLKNILFDFVIIDECCQASEIESLLAVCKGKSFILAGDPYQLGPVVKFGKSISLFERANIKTIWLCEQYRMNSNLIEFSNEIFYKNKIISNKNDDFKFFNEANIVFVDTAHSFFHENDECKSKFNIKEADIVISILKYIESKFSTLTVGVIAPYSAQTSYILEKFEKTECDIKISTVDSFQGQERDIIIISLVRSNNEEEIGFLNEIRRINVAMTRCKKGLLIIADSSTFRRKNFYGKLIKYLDEKAFCIDPENLMDIVQI